MILSLAIANAMIAEAKRQPITHPDLYLREVLASMQPYAPQRIEEEHSMRMDFVDI